MNHIIQVNIKLFRFNKLGLIFLCFPYWQQRELVSFNDHFKYHLFEIWSDLGHNKLYNIILNISEINVVGLSFHFTLIMY